MHDYMFNIPTVYKTFFISLFAPKREVAFLISAGAQFQSLAKSILMLSLAAFDLDESFHIFVVLGLTVLPDSSLVLFELLIRLQERM